ncbi:MAG TPA: hypothetical protein VFC63_12150 [Blastocatellia bacterium]|nr:hypothetical protein [Blastocatellia bacterium]
MPNKSHYNLRASAYNLYQEFDKYTQTQPELWQQSWHGENQQTILSVAEYEEIINLPEVRQGWALTSEKTIDLIPHILVTKFNVHSKGGQMSYELFLLKLAVLAKSSAIMVLRNSETATDQRPNGQFEMISQPFIQL